MIFGVIYCSTNLFSKLKKKTPEHSQFLILHLNSQITVFAFFFQRLRSTTFREEEISDETNSDKSRDKIEQESGAYHTSNV